MRAIAILVFSLVAAGPALGSPPTAPAAPAGAPAKARARKPEKPAKPAAKPPKPLDKKPTAAPAAPTTPATFGLGSMAAAAAGAAATAPSEKQERARADARRLDLTPKRQLEMSKASAADRRGSERTTGVGLGDDGDWRVQAAQVGVMAAAFTALWAVCGGGNCMLPDFLGSAEREGPAPDLQIREEPVLRDPR